MLPFNQFTAADEFFIREKKDIFLQLLGNSKRVMDFQRCFDAAAYDRNRKAVEFRKYCSNNFLEGFLQAVGGTVSSINYNGNFII